MASTSPVRTSLKQPIATEVMLTEVFPALNLGRIFWFAALSGIFCLIIVSAETLGAWIGFGLTGVVLFSSIAMLGRGKIVESLAILAYLAMVQPALRVYVRPLPYLTLEYFFVFWVIIALGKYKSRPLRAPAIFYLIYLVFEIVGVFGAFHPEVARSVLLSSLTIGFALFLVNKIRLGRADLSKLLTAIIIGVTNLIVIIGYGYATSTIDWGRQSNFAASGGMGPVQISMLLAIGVIIFLLLADRVSVGNRLIYLFLAAGIGLVMVLTFSRNGLYLTIIALVTYYFLFSKFSWRTFVIVLLLSILGNYLFEFATQVVGSAFAARYSNLNSSGRDLLVTYGWQIFLDHPLWGVGTSNYYQVVAQAEYLGSYSGAHNEFIRAAAEHGILGLFSWFFFGLSCIWLGFEVVRGKTRAFRMTLLFVFFAYLAVNGIKLLAQPLILLIALTTDEF